jgi:hypothetical protein
MRFTFSRNHTITVPRQTSGSPSRNALPGRGEFTGAVCRRALARWQARLLHQLHSDHRHTRTVRLHSRYHHHTRANMSAEAFNAWGWRIPFLASIVLVVISLYIRLKLKESPTFTSIKSSGKVSLQPLTDAFTKWDNLRTAAAYWPFHLRADGATSMPGCTIPLALP